MGKNIGNGILLSDARQREAAMHVAALARQVVECLQKIGHPHDQPMTLKLNAGLVVLYDPEALKDNLIATGQMRPVAKRPIDMEDVKSG